MLSNLEKANKIINEKILSTKRISVRKDLLEEINKLAEIMKYEKSNYLSKLATSLNTNYYKSIDKRISKETKGKIFACEKGCSHCCKDLKVTIPAMEIDYIVDFLNTLDKEKKDIIASNLKLLELEHDNKRDEQVSNTGIEHYFHMCNRESKLTYDCPFLISNECSIYEARPIICRTYLSKSYESCIKLGKADNVLGNIYSEAYYKLLEHENNVSYQEGGRYMDGYFPFFAIRYFDKKFYSLNRYNKFADFIFAITRIN